MRCPVDVEVDLVMTERQGIEIDYCPRCRGVWLDRGELDKIIERAAGDTNPPSYDDDRSRRDYDDDRSRRDYPDERYDPRRGKRRGGLFDLFDFD